ncbi:MAG: MFS transporter [Gemmatimonadota bacterium]
MRRYLVLAAAVLVQVCLGGIYAWSALAEALQQELGYSARQTQLTFGTVFLTFTTAVLVTGRLQDRYGPRPLVAVSGLLLMAGYGLAHSSSSFPLLWAGVGLLGGLAIACGYISTIAAAAGWFPRHRGAATGAVVAGYGSGAIAASQLIAHLRAQGVAARDLLLLLGSGYGLVILLGSVAVVAAPRTAGRVSRPSLRVRTLVRDPRLQQMFLAFLLGNLPGLMVLGSLKSIALTRGLPEAVAVAAISAAALGNMAGRLLWGAASDRLGYHRSAVASLLFIAAAQAGFAAAGSGSPGFLGLTFAVGFGFGSCLVLHAAQVGRIWGAERFGSAYPPVMLAHGLGALAGPYAAGWSFDATGSYGPALAAAVASVVAALAVYGLLRPAAARAQGEPGGR